MGTKLKQQMLQLCSLFTGREHKVPWKASKSEAQVCHNHPQFNNRNSAPASRRGRWPGNRPSSSRPV